MQRSIDAPDQVWSSAKEAAAWLGLTVPEFRSEIRRYPHLLPAHTFGRSHKWHAIDLAVYAYLRSAGRTGPASEEES